MINWFSPWNLLSRTRVRLHRPEFHENVSEQVVYPMTAREAWAYMCAHLKLVTADVALTQIESITEINNDGTAFGWRFSLDVLSQHAKGTVEWATIRHKNADVGGVKVTHTLAPYPCIGSPVYQVVAHGAGSCHLLDSAWEQMRQKAVDVPVDFVDSNTACLELFEQGMLCPFHLFTNVRHGQCVWEARKGEKTAVAQLCRSPVAVEE